jgi:hypothetical protein
MGPRNRVSLKNRRFSARYLGRNPVSSLDAGLGLFWCAGLDYKPASLIDTLRSKDTLDSADRVRLSLRPSNAVYLVTNRQAIVTSYFSFKCFQNPSLSCQDAVRSTTCHYLLFPVILTLGLKPNRCFIGAGISPILGCFST